MEQVHRQFDIQSRSSLVPEYGLSHLPDASADPRICWGLPIFLTPARPRAEATCLLSSIPKSRDGGILSGSPAWVFLLMPRSLGVGRLMLPGF